MLDEPLLAQIDGEGAFRIEWFGGFMSVACIIPKVEDVRDSREVRPSCVPFCETLAYASVLMSTYAKLQLAGRSGHHEWLVYLD